jgi:hypothetical protein
MGMTTGSRRSGALGAAADGDWKTTGGQSGWRRDGDDDRQ